MGRITIGITLGLGLLLGACQQPDPIGTGKDIHPIDTLPLSKSPDSSCTGLMSYKDIPWDSAQGHDTSTAWAGDSLVVQYQYGGGCRTHTFTPLCADYDKPGNPDKAILWVRHAGSSDPCKALLHRRLAFDAGTVKARVAGGPVRVRFVEDGPDNPLPGALPRISRAKADSMARHSAPFAIESWQEDGDSLIVHVAYSGGCRQHLFQIYASDYIYLSLPGQVDVWIYHLDDGDTCEARPRKRLAFDISELKRKDPLYVYRVIPMVP